MSSPSQGESNVNSTVDPEKYSKLLQEYAKIKKHNSVLKKAVLEEQEKTGALESSLKEREDKLRHYLEENDTLNFNNDRLSKRISALQEQLQEIQKNASSPGFFGKKAAQRKDEEIQLLQEELTEKIKENENIHTRISEIRKEHQAATDLLNSKLNSLKNTLQQKENELDSESKKFALERAVLESEISQLRTKLKELESEIEKMKNLLSEKEQELLITFQKLSSEIAKRQEIIDSKISFNDTKYSHLNALNISTLGSQNSHGGGQQIEHSIPFVKQLILTFDSHHKCWIERLTLINGNTGYSESLKAINRKIISILPDFTRYLQSLADDLLFIFPKVKIGDPVGIDSYKGISSKFQLFIDFNKQLLSCHLLRLDEESKQTQCSNSMRANNTLLSETRFQLQADLEEINFVLQRYLVPTESYNATTLLNQISSSFKSLVKTFQTLLTQTAYKISQEHQDPFILPALRESNEKTLSTQSGVIVILEKLSELFEEYVENSKKSGGYFVRGAKISNTTETSKLHKMTSKAKNYIQQVNSQQKIDFISYEESLKNRKVISDLREELDAIRVLLKATEGKFETALKEKAAVQTELAITKDQVAEKQAQATGLLGELANVRDQLQRSLLANSQLQQQKSQLELQVNQLQSSFNQMKQQLVESQKIISDLNSKLENTTRENPPSTELDSKPISQDPVILDLPKESPNQQPQQISNDNNSLISFEDTPSNSSNSSVSFTSSSSSAVVVDLLTSETEYPIQPISLVNIAEPPKIEVQPYKLIVMDETGKMSDNLNVSTEDKERENAFKMFYENKIKQMDEQLHTADEKALKFFAAYKHLKDVLQKAISEREKLSEDLKKMKSNLESTAEEVISTRKGYEEQMIVLTEHMAGQNERIAKLDEEMGLLLGNKVLCTKCKKWNTLRWLITEGKNGQKCSGGNHATNFNFAS